MSRLGDMTPKPADLAFFTKNPTGPASGAEIQTLPLSAITESDQLCLRTPPFPGIEELALSIKEAGQSTPLFVRPMGSQFELISGYRRHAALKHLKAPSALARIFRTLSDSEAYALAISENADRNDLTDWERALACKRMRDDGLSIEEIANRFNWKSRKNVELHLRAQREAFPALAAALQAGSLTLSHAIALLQAFANTDATSEQQEVVLRAALEKGTAVSKIPALVRVLTAPASLPAPETPQVEGWHCRETKAGAISFRGIAKANDAEQLDALANELASLLKKVRRKSRKLANQTPSDGGAS